MPRPEPRPTHRPRSQYSEDRVEPPMLPADLYTHNRVTKILLKNREYVNFKLGTYKEYSNSAAEIYVGTDYYTMEKVCGPTSEIVAIWWAEEEKSDDSSTT